MVVNNILHLIIMNCIFLISMNIIGLLYKTRVSFHHPSIHIMQYYTKIKNNKILWLFLEDILVIGIVVILIQYIVMILIFKNGHVYLKIILKIKMHLSLEVVNIYKIYKWKKILICKIYNKLKIEVYNYSNYFYYKMIFYYRIWYMYI